MLTYANQSHGLISCCCFHWGDYIIYRNRRGKPRLSWWTYRKKKTGRLIPVQPLHISGWGPHLLHFPWTHPKNPTDATSGSFRGHIPRTPRVSVSTEHHLLLPTQAQQAPLWMLRAEHKARTSLQQCSPPANRRSGTPRATNSVF